MFYKFKKSNNAEKETRNIHGVYKIDSLKERSCQRWLVGWLCFTAYQPLCFI